MGGYVSSVVAAVKAAGIPAEAAYPGRRMPSITKPVAAVSLEEADYTQNTATVLITVMSPASQGGAVCEATAETAGKAAARLVIAGMDTACVQDACRFDSNADCYYAQIRAAFSPTPEPEPVPKPAFSATHNGTALAGAVGFTAWREADPDNGIPLENAVWQIQLEEEFAPGQAENVVSWEGFQLTVTRGKSVETFGGCTWTAVKREDSGTSLRQIRTGTAGSRSFAAK